MMRESPLKEELLRDIDREVEQTLARGRQDVDELVAEARRRQQTRERDGLRLLEEELAVARRRAMARAELEGRNALLRVKREETDRVFAAARERLARMATEEPGHYLELLEHIFHVCRRLLPPGPVRVRLAPGLAALGERLTQERSTEATVDPELNGIVLESSDGRLHCDGSLEALLERLRRERAAEIEAILFGEEHERKG